LAHNGVDIIDYVLYTIYPAAAFFAIGIAAKKTGMRQLYVYMAQSAACFAFAVAYMFIPQGGGQGLAVILGMFGALLLFMARKQKLQEKPAEQ
jgi:phosphatidylserine synthase